jgi:hypothetical protein
MPLSRRRRLSFAAERNMSSAAMRGTAHSAGVEEHITRERIVSELGRSRVWPSADGAGGPHREGEEPKPMMHGRGTSGEAIVAMKPANKAERSVAEWSQGPRPRGMRVSTARTGHRTGHACHTRWSAYGDVRRLTRGGSRMRESRTYGSVRGAPSNGRPYRDREAAKARLRASATRYCPPPQNWKWRARFALPAQHPFLEG